MMNTAELQSLVHARWQERVVDACRERGWRPARHGASGGAVPWEEVASTAVEAIWSDVEAIVSPILELLAANPVADPPPARPAPARQSPTSLCHCPARPARSATIFQQRDEALVKKRRPGSGQAAAA